MLHDAPESDSNIEENNGENTEFGIRGTIFKRKERIDDGALIVGAQGQIVWIGPFNQVRNRKLDIVGQRNWIVGPGFIDIHFHGYGDPERRPSPTLGDFGAIDWTAKTVAQYGVTGFLATLLIRPRNYLDQFYMLNHLVGKSCNGARLLGYHIENLALNKERRGAIPAEMIWDPPPRKSELDDALNASERHIKIAVVAPEMDEPTGFSITRRLAAEGITVSIGHTKAYKEIVLKALQAGISHLNHMFNAMTELRQRDPGAVIVGLVDLQEMYPQILNPTAELICDFIHIDPEVILMAIRARGPEKVALITDAVAPPDAQGVYSCFDEKVIVEHGAVRKQKDRQTLSGSCLTMHQAFYNVHRYLGYSLQDAFTMASTIPAYVSGIHNTGVLEVGKRADIVVLDEDLRIRRTIVEGKIVHSWDPAAPPSQSVVRIAANNNSGRAKVIGVSIGKKGVLCGCVTFDSGDNYIVNEILPIKEIEGLEGRESIINISAEAINDIYNRVNGQVEAIGIVCPGFVDTSSGEVVAAYHLPDWGAFNLKQEIKQQISKLGLLDIPISIHNDARSMALAEARFGIRKSISNVAFVRLEGLSAQGIIANNRVVSCLERTQPRDYEQIRRAVNQLGRRAPIPAYQLKLMETIALYGEFALIPIAQKSGEVQLLRDLVSAGALSDAAERVEQKLRKILFRQERFYRERYDHSPRKRLDAHKIYPCEIAEALGDKDKEVKNAAEMVIKEVGNSLGLGLQSILKYHHNIELIILSSKLADSCDITDRLIDGAKEVIRDGIPIITSNYLKEADFPVLSAATICL